MGPHLLQPRSASCPLVSCCFIIIPPALLPILCTPGAGQLPSAWQLWKNAPPRVSHMRDHEPKGVHAPAPHGSSCSFPMLTLLPFGRGSTIKGDSLPPCSRPPCSHSPTRPPPIPAGRGTLLLFPSRSFLYLKPSEHVSRLLSGLRGFLAPPCSIALRPCPDVARTGHSALGSSSLPPAPGSVPPPRPV